ncbi:ROK family transcriptional regulator [Nonomuraea sp. NEAU-A123]|uniref:ROK family transcriptional regulator n=1 Tax=Nonomuraea sp. NEAU-A123 TaxID=2839649 RepID=UPI001BE4D9A1|nr:ROK family transcriptional regulator [Nonomuraea sp. NEAU-A123]MBT2227603.1 ROK family transcriptional regulator [Nonomuraea sp. NEAU-A123]
MRTATPSTARAINDRLVLDLLLDRGPLTAPQVRELTGLSRPTVSDLIERLQAGGLIQVTGEAGGDRRGPNARLYGIVAGRAHVAGVDVRRSVVNVTVADITGRIAGSAVRELDGDLDVIIADALAEAAGPLAMHAVVVGAPGLVDPRTGDLSLVNDVPGRHPGLLEAMRARIAAPVLLENEVNLAAIAEHRAGSAVGRDDFALLWLDDGVGAAVVLGGRLRRGVSGGAGEIGFLDTRSGLLCDLLSGNVVDGLGTGGPATGGPQAAGPVMGELAVRVAAAAFPMVAVVDPGLVILAGRTGRAGGEKLALQVADRLAALAPVLTEVRVTTVVGNPVLMGAVDTALSMARDDIFGTPSG